MKPGFDELKSQVIDKGLCTLCGTCIGVCHKKSLRLVYGKGEPEVELEGECSSCGVCYYACPGADIPLLELEKFCFGRVRENKPDDLGIFTFSGMGYATDERIRRAGASGGVTTALLVYGLEKGLIDGALVAGFSRDKPWQTEAKIATTREELIEAAESKYAPVTINSLLNEAVEQGFRHIAIVGCPCHIHAIRKLEYQHLERKITKRIELLLGLCCGAQFSPEGTKHVLAEKCGIHDLTQITRLHYRDRGSGWTSQFAVELANGQKKVVPKSDAVFGGLMFFRRDRCAMCIEWSAELSDISLADYWGPPVNPGDASSYSSLLIRTDRGAEWCWGAQKAGYVVVRESSADYLVKSLGFENKKHGNVFVLENRRRHGWPTPDYHYLPSYAPLKY